MMKMPRRVLVTLDGSEFSERILPFLPAILRYGDEVVMLAVGPPPRPIRRRLDLVDQPLVVGARVELEPASPQYVEVMDLAIQRERDELKDYLEDRAIILRNEGFSVTTEVLLGEFPAKTIIDYARELGPLFVAMATHGRTGLAHTLSGSVAEEVVRSRVAPVLLIRP